MKGARRYLLIAPSASGVLLPGANTAVGKKSAGYLIKLLQLVQDGIALYFFLRVLVPIAEMKVLFERQQSALVIGWLILAIGLDGGQLLWRCLLRPRWALVGFGGYAMYLIVVMYAEHGLDADRHLWSLIVTLPLYVMGCYYGLVQPRRFWRLCVAVFAILGAQAAISITPLVENPQLTRRIMAYKDYDLQYQGALLGIGHYGLYASTALLTVVVAGLGLQKDARFPFRAICLAAWIALVMAVIGSTFAAMAIVAVFGSLAILWQGLLTEKRRIRNFVLIGITAMFAGAIYVGYRSYEAFEYTQNKAVNIFKAVGTEGLSADPTMRGTLMFWSINAIISHPLVGVGASGRKTLGAVERVEGEVIGGHSSWLDILGQYGLVGAVWCYMILFSIAREIWRARKMNKDDPLAAALLIALGCYFILGVIDNVHRIPQADFVFYFVLLGGAFAMQHRVAVSEAPGGRPTTRDGRQRNAMPRR